MLFEGFKSRPRFDEYDPIGGNSVVGVSLTTTTTYTVPTGKTLLIKGLLASGNNCNLLADGVVLAALNAGTAVVDKFRTYWTGTPNFVASPTVATDSNFLLPVRSGTVLSSSTTTLHMYGWLVDE